LQQPEAQDAALQTHLPFEHAEPPVQAAQAAPAVPHVALLEGWQCPLASQHPFGQDAALQTHWPCALQLWSEAQATHCPPLAPHADFEAVMHPPFWQHPLQAPPPQVQAPAAVQVWPAAHAMQALPADPHACADVGVTQ
jgi:hypothetical protein